MRAAPHGGLDRTSSRPRHLLRREPSPIGSTGRSRPPTGALSCTLRASTCGSAAQRSGAGRAAALEHRCRRLSAEGPEVPQALQRGSLRRRGPRRGARPPPRDVVAAVGRGPAHGLQPCACGRHPGPGGARRSLLLSRARRSFWDPHGHLLRQSLLGHSTLRDRRTRQVPADGRFALSVVRMAGAPSLCAWNADSWRSSSRSLKREASHRRPAASGSLNRRFPMRSDVGEGAGDSALRAVGPGRSSDSGRGGPGWRRRGGRCSPSPSPKAPFVDSPRPASVASLSCPARCGPSSRSFRSWGSSADCSPRSSSSSWIRRSAPTCSRAFGPVTSTSA